MPHGSANALRLSAMLAAPSTRQQAIGEIANALEKTKGDATRAGRELDVHYNTLTKWITLYPELERRVATVREKYGHPHVDRAEARARVRPSAQAPLSEELRAVATRLVEEAASKKRRAAR
jgi:hypothetical protein